MPIAHIYLLEGRTDEQRRAVITQVTQALASALSAKPETVRVLLHDVPNTDWGIGGVPAKDLKR